MRKPFQKDKSHASRTTKKRIGGQSMIEYVVVIAGLFLVTYGSHTAWQALMGNRLGISDARGTGQDYVNVESIDGSVHNESLSLLDAVEGRSTTFRNKIAEISY